MSPSSGSRRKEGAASPGPTRAIQMSPLFSQLFALGLAAIFISFVGCSGGVPSPGSPPVSQVDANKSPARPRKVPLRRLLRSSTARKPPAKRLRRALPRKATCRRFPKSPLLWSNQSRLSPRPSDRKAGRHFATEIVSSALPRRPCRRIPMSYGNSPHPMASSLARPLSETRSMCRVSTVS
jgi:hypothetical protein